MWLPEEDLQNNKVPSFISIVGYKIYNLPCQIFLQCPLGWLPLLVVSGARVVSPREKCGSDAYNLINSVKKLELFPLPISSIV